MAQPLRVEIAEMTWHISSRTQQSKLWFVNNQKLEENILGFLAKYQEKYEVILYQATMMGNHLHLVAAFPQKNKSHFMRDLKSQIARLTKRHQEDFGRGCLWERRYSSEALPLDADVENMFLYCALNPVSSGLVERLEHYPFYNSCYDAIRGISREFTLVDWRLYSDRSRYNKNLEISDFEHTYTLTYTRLPGYEDLSAGEYEERIRAKLEERREQKVTQRRAEGKGFLGRKKLLRLKPGSKPRSTKLSTRHSKRPLVLSTQKDAEKDFLNRYWWTRDRYSECVKCLRSGQGTVQFPPDTYPPPLLELHPAVS